MKTFLIELAVTYFLVALAIGFLLFFSSDANYSGFLFGVFILSLAIVLGRFAILKLFRKESISFDAVVNTQEIKITDNSCPVCGVENLKLRIQIFDFFHLPRIMFYCEKCSRKIKILRPYCND